jgi:BirA family biotin operon repressor/biotin-[acetyl-CoA-carboxylase] ligase
LIGDHLDYAIVGIGINVNVPSEALPQLAPRATSVLAETGCATDRLELLVALLMRVESRYERLRNGENPIQEWASRLVTLGRRVEVTTSEDVLHGVATGVAQDGALLLQMDDGTLRRLLAGDVTLSRG